MIIRCVACLALTMAVACGAPLQAQRPRALLGPLLEQAFGRMAWLNKTDTLYLDSASLRETAAVLDVPGVPADELARSVGRAIVLTRLADVPRINEKPPTSWRDRSHAIYVHVGSVDISDAFLKMVFTFRGGAFGKVQVKFVPGRGTWVVDRADIIEIS